MSDDEVVRARWLPWMRAVIMCGASAFCIGAMSWGVGPVLAMVGPTALVLLFAGIAATSAESLAGAPGRASRWRWWLGVGACCVSVPLCAAVIGALSASLAWLWLAVVVISSPVARRRLRTVPARAFPRAGRTVDGPELAAEDEGGGRAPAGREAATSTQDALSDVRTLTTPDLCRTWRATFWMLRDSSGPARTLLLVELRSAIIDELEVREPTAVEEWLTSGRRLADGPARYL